MVGVGNICASEEEGNKWWKHVGAIETVWFVGLVLEKSSLAWKIYATPGL
jgi:hypothetical protein